MPRPEEIHDDLLDRLKDAKDQGWLGKVAAIETSVAAAEDKLSSMREMTDLHTTTSLGMPGFPPPIRRPTHIRQLTHVGEAKPPRHGPSSRHSLAGVSRRIFAARLRMPARLRVLGLGWSAVLQCR
ncbi:hypothetical protein [Streptomyces sp. R35]|uniref:Uncharacterized protein n=1 Tax=Streptomyces sp. R35 TaxID=3238630 RepID=A0AB39SIJ3_9ACTN